MAKKNTAHRPSQSHLEYVRTRDGRRVKNTAYIPHKKTTVSAPSPTVLPSQSTTFDKNRVIDKLRYNAIQDMRNDWSNAGIVDEIVANKDDITRAIATADISDSDRDTLTDFMSTMNNSNFMFTNTTPEALNLLSYAVDGHVYLPSLDRIPEQYEIIENPEKGIKNVWSRFDDNVNFVMNDISNNIGDVEGSKNVRRAVDRFTSLEIDDTDIESVHTGYVALQNVADAFGNMLDKNRDLLDDDTIKDFADDFYDVSMVCTQLEHFFNNK